MPKRHYCIQCGKKIENSFQTKFCSRKCWEEYKLKNDLIVSSERQATVFLKTPFSDSKKSDKENSENGWITLDTSKKVSLFDEDDPARLFKSPKKKQDTSQKKQTIKKEQYLKKIIQQKDARISALKKDLERKELTIESLKEEITRYKNKISQAFNGIDTVDEVIENLDLLRNNPRDEKTRFSFVRRLWNRFFP